MRLEELVCGVESRVRAFGKRLWPGDQGCEWREEIVRLCVALNQHFRRALHYREEIERLRTRLAENEVRAAVLASRVETYIHIGDQPAAYRDALELDRVRRQLAEDQPRLPCEEKSYQGQQARIADLERRLAELEERLRFAASCE
jgi:hypothetical protein